MAGAGVNLAITKDGGAYNKLRRPDDYLITSGPQRPPLPVVERPPLENTNKRKREQDALLRNKRSKQGLGYSHDGSGQPALDFGQKTGLPSGDDDDDFSDDSTSAALAYLRSVRFEASAIPDVLFARPDDLGDDEDNEGTTPTNPEKSERLIYEDGIWISLDADEEATSGDYKWGDQVAAIDPQDACYKSLLKRFSTLRSQMLENKTDVPRSPSDQSGHSESIRIPNAKHEWMHIIHRDFPSTAQFRKLKERDVFFGIQNCASSLTNSLSISKQKSCWIWALLASAPEFGTLNYELVGKIRDLGMQASRLSGRMRKAREKKLEAERKQEVIEPAKVNGHDNTEADVGVSKADVTKIAGSVMEKSHEKASQDASASPMSLSQTEGANDEEPKNDQSGSDAEMSMSEDGEVHDAPDLDQVRARLLAQLGDRIVQSNFPKVFDSRDAAEKHRAQIQGKTEPSDSQMPKDIKLNLSEDPDFDWNTTSTIDMILTVAAELYGQKDLLQYREAW